VLDVLKAANHNILGSFKNGKIMLKGDRYMLKSRVIESLKPAVGKRSAWDRYVVKELLCFLLH
jgi:hypothetical protein